MEQFTVQMNQLAQLLGADPAAFGIMVGIVMALTSSLRRAINVKWPNFDGPWVWALPLVTGMLLGIVLPETNGSGWLVGLRVGVGAVIFYELIFKGKAKVA